MHKTRVAGWGSLPAGGIALLLGLVFCLQPAAAQAGGRTRTNFNVGWKFNLGTPGGTPQEAGFNDSSWETVSVPHTLKLTSLDLDGSTDDNHQKTFHRYVGWYRKHFRVNAGAKVFLEFEGSHEVTDVWVNGKHAGKHTISGYTPFDFDITGEVNRSGDNVVAIRVDNTLNADVPPDGGTRDYILFGGLYRDVYLVTTDKVHVTFPWDDTYAGVFVTTPTVKAENATISVRTTVRNEYDITKPVTSMIRTCQGKTELPLHSKERPESR
jgi:beta-galactosidase